LQVKPDLEKKFIYAPLNFQPERTTSPQGDMFYDQILMIETLAHSLPRDWVIYVKEHPSQWIFKSKTNYSNFRYKGYYEKIAKLKNVFLVPTNTDTFVLTNKSRAVATVAGTAGWEAVLRRKPVLIFGYVWYRDCPGLFKVNDVESCREALEKIAGGFRVEEQKIINYLKSFDEATTHGYFEEIDAPDSELTKEENKQSIAQAILTELEKNN
jgi:capsule polysaccharide export protein KpsC/LpsZ